uniref:Uncharacterized protein n=1 Tax=Cacopsylla melanoneura TaxID=428564 RepID=A0A8D8VTG8_9HEMI
MYFKQYTVLDETNQILRNQMTKIILRPILRTQMTRTILLPILRNQMTKTILLPTIRNQITETIACQPRKKHQRHLLKNPMLLTLKQLVGISTNRLKHNQPFKLHH